VVSPVITGKTNNIHGLVGKTREAAEWFQWALFVLAGVASVSRLRGGVPSSQV